jgi:succinate dehydrogenase / fumarate reductase membrane anchor subunit
MSSNKSHSGVSHWFNQRISALVLIPVIPWLLYSFILFVKSETNLSSFFFNNILNTSLAIITVVSMFYHSTSGLKVIFEDYIPNKPKRIKVILVMQIFNILIATITIITILKLFTTA